MMTVHDHIEGSFWGGTNQRSGGALGGGVGGVGNEGQDPGRE